MRILRALAALLAIALLAGACAGDPGTAPDPTAAPAAISTDTTGVAPPVDDGGDDPSNIDALPALPAVALDAEDAELVAVEAQWLCDIQRRSFTDLADLEVARASLLANSGVSDDRYEAFQARLETSTDLRLAVLAAFQGTCTA